MHHNFQKHKLKIKLKVTIDIGVMFAVLLENNLDIQKA